MNDVVGLFAEDEEAPDSLVSGSRVCDHLVLQEYLRHAKRSGLAFLNVVVRVVGGARSFEYR